MLKFQRGIFVVLVFFVFSSTSWSICGTKHPSRDSSMPGVDGKACFGHLGDSCIHTCMEFAAGQACPSGTFEIGGGGGRIKCAAWDSFCDPWQKTFIENDGSRIAEPTNKTSGGLGYCKYLVKRKTLYERVFGVAKTVPKGVGESK